MVSSLAMYTCSHFTCISVFTAMIVRTLRGLLFGLPGVSDNVIVGKILTNFWFRKGEM